MVFTLWTGDQDARDDSGAVLALLAAPADVQRRLLLLPRRRPAVHRLLQHRLHTPLLRLPLARQRQRLHQPSHLLLHERELPGNSIIICLHSD